MNNFYYNENFICINDMFLQTNLLQNIMYFN
jgi:hypothetical protein